MKYLLVPYQNIVLYKIGIVGGLIGAGVGTLISSKLICKCSCPNPNPKCSDK
jgi:hypothetical protein